MHTKFTFVIFSSIFFVSCATVPVESFEKAEMVKEFNPPSNGNAALYIYRAGIYGSALKKDVWINGKCVGQTAPNVFFYEEVKGGMEHKISTESEFSPNDLIVNTESGKNYFIRQYIKVGVFVNGAGLELVEEETGRNAVEKLKLAERGDCTSTAKTMQ